MQNKLIELTDVVINDIMKYEIVLPSLYKEKFEEKAKELDINIEDETELMENMLDKEFSKANKLMNSTRNSVSKLETFASNASEAIKNKDDKQLDTISLEIDKLKSEMKKINFNLYMDVLTKTFNKVWLFEQFLKNDTFETDGTLSLIDISKFKNINEDYGLLVGDKILIFFANFLKQKFKSSKIIRFGVDIFLILSNEHAENIKQELESYLQELQAKKLKAPNGDAIYVSFHFGVVKYQEDDVFRDVFEISETLLNEDKKSSH